MGVDEMQQVILEKLRLAQNCGFPSRLAFCMPNLNIPQGGYIVSAPRLDIVLSGYKRVALPLADGAGERVMTPGEAFFAPPGTWEWHAWDTKAEFLCIVPRKDDLRVSYYHQRSARRRPDAIFYHTGRKCSEPVTQLMRMLSGRGAESSAASLHLVRALVGFAIDDCELEPPLAEGKVPQRFLEITRWLQNHFQDNIGRDQAADRFGITPAYLTHIFRQMTGNGFHDYLTRLRLDFARSLLIETELPVRLIAIQSGFSNPVHFVRRFREIEGVPPGEFRKIERR